MNFVNKKALFEYQVIEEWSAGIQLLGSEVKSLRRNNFNFHESFCYIWDGELFVKNWFISKYFESSYLNHEEKRTRKLLLRKREIGQIEKLSQIKGHTIIPISLFTYKGRFKMKIAVCKGKKNWDKRMSIKSRDIKREMDRGEF